MPLKMRDDLKHLNLMFAYDNENGGFIIYNLPFSEYRTVEKIVTKYGYRLDISGILPVIRFGKGVE
jgi:hypothetical protein